ncbi:hypothetical protein TH53_04510 [Pedobacter lusitanus]|uniref:Uncharacterized protein n=1 Tax=Pedobacter lusitanus TaxID=1503925 RepID=A0A0D0GM24_9SPHI|nr:hypothetical protein [Pedobacter lusitanus]KIO78282.1 hypothetical protein TH53_04510 [Pedobacter lusitanus]
MGYLVVISFNGKPVGLTFDADGVFKKVLEQREKRDLTGIGWHVGGRFDDRDGRHRDTIAIAALPGTIRTYFTNNYPKDTLQRAFVNRDTSYPVISSNTGVFLNAFTSAGLFIKRVQLYPRVKLITNIGAGALPANITAYLNTTYPAYVFSNAWDLNLNGSVKGYLVLISANYIKYAVVFDGSGNFAGSITVR